MPPSLDNPFRKPPRSKKEAEEISELLTGEESIVKDQQKKGDPVVELSAEEQKSRERVENEPWTRNEMQDWVEKMNLNPAWIDRNLKETKDGYWTSPSLNLSTVTDSKEMPKGIIEVETTLYLDKITSAENLVLPKKIGSLSLRSLESAKGLVFPKDTEWVDLYNLKSIEDLELPDGFEGALFTSFLTDEQMEILKEKYPKIRLTRGI